MRDIGTVLSGKPSVDDTKKLAKSAFQIGDYIDVAITGTESRFMDRYTEFRSVLPNKNFDSKREK